MTRRLTVTLALALTVTGLSAADKKVQMKDLPATVQKSVQAEEARGATIVGLATEVEGGKTMYEAVVEKNGKKTGVVVNAAGKATTP